MTTKNIVKGDSSFLMKTVMPDDWDPSDTVTVSIYDVTDGTAIVDTQAVTRYTADTLSTAVIAGSFSAVLTTGNALEDSQKVAIGGSAQGWQRLTVDRYTASSKTVEFTRSTQEDLDSGSNVLGLDLNYTVDASVTAFDDLRRVKVVWSPSGDGTPLMELWEIVSERSTVQGLESRFRTAYTDLYDTIQPEEFPEYEQRARQSLKLYFEGRLRNFDKIVDSDLIIEPMLTEIALLMGMKLSEEEYNRLLAKRDRDLTALNQLSIWTDTNEDNKESESESQPAQAFILQRGA
jgi:hypothetical protein